MVLNGFWVNAPAVVSEIVDDEIIIIHLETGTYFSLGGAGVTVWQLLVGGTTADVAAASLCATHDVEPDVAHEAVERLFADFIREDLVAPASVSAEIAPLPLTPTRPRTRFVSPKFERYIDMQTMIQLDPILEVDDRGWPLGDPR